MAVSVFTSFEQICDSNGVPVSGGTVAVYAAGTTTLLDCFTDSALSVAATNPIPLNGVGRHQQGMVYIAPGSYKALVRDADGVTLFVCDYIDSGIPVGTGALAIANGGTGATTAAAALSALGGATAAELADITAEVAAISGALGSSEKTQIANGTTAQRPASPAAGQIRHNSTTDRYEGYNNAATIEQFMTDSQAASNSDGTTGTSTTKFMTPASTRAASAFQSALLHVQDQKASNTSGGTFTSGSWATRTLNTSVTNEITGASLGSNQIPLPAGTYYIEASAPAYSVDLHKVKLRNTTDSTDVLHGTSEQAENTRAVSNRSFLSGRFTIAAQKVFELQHRCSTTFSTSGLGVACNFSVVEVYSDVRIWKVA